MLLKSLLSTTIWAPDGTGRMGDFHFDSVRQRMMSTVSVRVLALAIPEWPLDIPLRRTDPLTGIVWSKVNDYTTWLPE